jgi:hypothetical protein
MRSLPAVAFILALGVSTPASAGDHEFRGVVRSIESAYGVHHMHIPLLGVALFFARPAGVGGLKLAIFEGFKTPTDIVDVSRVIESSLGSDWHSFVRVRSKGDTNGETTFIYASPAGGRMRMMIVCLEPSEATVVELNLNDRAIKRWMKEPDEEAENQSGRRHGDDYKPKSKD